MQRGIFFEERELENINRVINCIDADIGGLWNREEIWKDNTRIQMLLSCLSRDIQTLRKQLSD